MTHGKQEQNSKWQGQHDWSQISTEFRFSQIQIAKKWSSLYRRIYLNLCSFREAHCVLGINSALISNDSILLHLAKNSLFFLQLCNFRLLLKKKKTIYVTKILSLTFEISVLQCCTKVIHVSRDYYFCAISIVLWKICQASIIGTKVKPVTLHHIICHENAR